MDKLSENDALKRELFPNNIVLLDRITDFVCTHPLVKRSHHPASIRPIFNKKWLEVCPIDQIPVNGYSDFVFGVLLDSDKTSHNAVIAKEVTGQFVYEKSAGGSDEFLFYINNQGNTRAVVVQYDDLDNEIGVLELDSLSKQQNLHLIEIINDWLAANTPPDAKVIPLFKETLDIHTDPPL